MTNRREEDLRKVTFNGDDLHDLDGVYIMDIDYPLFPPKNKNRVEVPGKDYSYDFGSDRKMDFTVTIDFRVLAPSLIPPGEGESEEASLEDRLTTLINKLDTEEPKSLVVGTLSTDGMVFDSPRYSDLDDWGDFVDFTVTFDCGDNG